MKNYIDIDCGECKECCHFHLFIGEILSLKEIETLFFFNKKLADTFFKNTDDEYLIDTECINHYNNKCLTHHTKDYPCICALYPLILAKNIDSKIKIYLDKNCPQWKNILKNLEDVKYINNILQIINFYKIRKQLDIFKYKDLKKCGYRLKPIMEIKI